MMAGARPGASEADTAESGLKKAAIGVDVGGTKIACGLVDMRGGLVATSRRELASGSAGEPARQIASMAAALMREGSRLGFTTVACGVAVPAAIDRAAGRVIWAPNIQGWENYPLAEVIRAELRVPVYLDHDGPAAVLGEQWAGAARGARDAVYLIVGTGVGAGLILDGRVHRGAHGFAGGIGWFGLEAAAVGNSMYRGKGFLETMAAGPSLARRYAETIGEAPAALAAEDVFAAAGRGDERAVRILREACQYLGLAVANLVSLLNPEIVILGGGIGRNLGPYLPDILEIVRRTAQPQAAAEARLVTAVLGEEAGILGAAREAFAASGVEIHP